jgi:hypothetical protein
LADFTLLIKQGGRMYIRWNRRKRTKTGWRKKPGCYLTAVAVENHRVNGSPRQRVIKSIGSIGEERLGKIYDRKKFWETVERNLHSISISDGDKEKIISSIAKVVPKPSEDEIERDLQESIQLLKQIEQRIKKM